MYDSHEVPNTIGYMAVAGKRCCMTSECGGQDPLWIAQSLLLLIFLYEAWRASASSSDAEIIAILDSTFELEYCTWNDELRHVILVK